MLSWTTTCRQDLFVVVAFFCDAQDATAPGVTTGAPAAVLSVALRKRLMAELRHLSSNQHPAFDVDPSEANIAFWKVVLEAPVESSCLYAGATYLLTMEFPPTYPQHAPLVRFVSPIKHVNVNAHGRVCHGILGRDWASSAQVRQVFDSVYWHGVMGFVENEW